MLITSMAGFIKINVGFKVRNYDSKIGNIPESLSRFNFPFCCVYFFFQHFYFVFRVVVVMVVILRVKMVTVSRAGTLA